MIAQLEIVPLGTGSAGVSGHVARVVRLIQASGLPYRVGAMGTVIEGDWTAVMKVIKKMREKLLKRSKRIYITIAIDDRQGERRRRLIESKVKTVEQILGKALKK